MPSKDIVLPRVAQTPTRRDIRNMNEKTKPLNLAQVIALHKGDRTYVKLAKDCQRPNDTEGLNHAYIHKMATKPIKDVPGTPVLKKLAYGLRVRESVLLQAAAVSVGLDYQATAPEDLVIKGAGNLPSSSQQALITMAEAMLWWKEQVDAGATEEDATVTPLRAVPSTTPDWSKTAADSSAASRAEGDIDPERPEDTV